MANLLELAGYVQKQGDLGRQRGEQSRLASLASQAYTAPRADRQGLLGQMAQTSPDAAVAQQKLFRQGDSDRMSDLSRKAKLFVGMAETGNAQAVAALYPQIAQEARDLGLGDIPLEYNDTFLPGLKKFASILDDGQASEVGVQSTYVDSQGNRVAILRDGSTRTLGQNAPNTQIIDTGANGFFGVNKSNLSASPVMIGGQPQQAPQPSLQAGLYQTPAGMVRIGEGLTPEQQQAALMDIQSGGAVDSVQLQARDVAPQQFGGGQQLRSAPKQAEQFTTLSAQEVQALGLPQGTVAQRSPSGQVQIVNKPRDLPSNGQIIDNGDGTTTFIPAGKTTEGERNAAGFYQRMVNARSELDALERAGYKPDNAQDRFGAALDDTPLIGGLLAPIGRSMTSTQGQQYQQAAMNWIRANLRKESGAAIGVKEANDEYRNYFPVLGDTPEVIAQKARNRLVVEQAMRSAAGGALPPPRNDRGGRYKIGQVIEANGKRYRITGLSDPNDPDVEEVR